MAGRLEPLGAGGSRGPSLAPLGREPSLAPLDSRGEPLPPPRRPSATGSAHSDHVPELQPAEAEPEAADAGAADGEPEMIESEEELEEEPGGADLGEGGPPSTGGRSPDGSEVRNGDEAVSGDGADAEEEEDRRASDTGSRRRSRSSGGAQAQAPSEDPPVYPPPPPDQYDYSMTGQPALLMAEVDVAEAMRKVRGAFQRDTMKYMKSLGPIDWLARPSLLQRRVKEGKNTMLETVRPWLEDDGLYLARFQVDENDGIIPEFDTPQFKIELSSLKGIPKKVIQGREELPQLQLVRAALYDATSKTFHGNVHTVVCNKTSDKGATWHFPNKPVIICRSRRHLPPQQNPDLQVYFEFNVSYPLTRKEAEHLPPTHKRAAEQVDELTVAWVLIPFVPSISLRKPQTMTLPLMCGPLLRGQDLSKLQDDAQNKKGFLSKMTKRKTRPQVTLKIVPVADDEARHENYSLLPDNVCTDVHTAMMISCYRTVLAAQLARAPTYMSTVCDPVVVAFPTLVDDPHMRVMLHRTWDQHVKPLEGVRVHEMEVLVRIFRQVVTILWPALHSQAVPASSIMNFNLHQAARMKKLTEFQSTHPVQSLSHNAYQWLHKPFDIQELAYSYADGLGPSVD